MFHLMECDVFYDTHPPYQGTGDRCSRNEIAAGTATQFSILGMSTTFCGTHDAARLTCLHMLSGHLQERSTSS